MSRNLVCCALALLAISASHKAFAGPDSNDQLRQQIIRQSVAAYVSTGHPCACPYSLTRKGFPCGSRSAYTRPGGEKPLCFPSDVSELMVSDSRRQHATEGHEER